MTTIPLRAFLVVLCLLVTSRSRADAPATRPEATKVACVGDSITFGARIDDREHKSYPAQLSRLLGDGWDVRNFGVSGATMLKKGDKPYDKQKAYQQALDFKPDIVVIMLGTNDSKPQNWDAHKDDYVADYNDLIAGFRQANPQAKIYVCIPVPAFPGKSTIRGEVIDKEVIPKVREIADETHAMLIDLHAPLEGKKEMFPDNIHPNAEGAGVMAGTICDVLKHAAPTSAPAH